MSSDFARYEDESLNIEWNITLKKKQANFLNPKKRFSRNEISVWIWEKRRKKF